MTKSPVNRRHVLAGGVLAAGTALLLLPRGAPRAALPARGTFTPESFGARGDGRSDDYDAFARLVRAVNQAGGGTVVLTAGRTYRLGRYRTPRSGVSELVFEGCDPLVIEGNGAAISVEGRFRRTAAEVYGLPALRIGDSRNVTVRNLELNGNVQETTRAPGLYERGAMTGLTLMSCSGVLVENVFAHHFGADGMFIRESASTDASGRRLVSRDVTVRRSRFLFNARQGLTISALRGGLFEDCDFSYTGFIDRNGTIGQYGGHSPAAGVDIEPDNTPIDGKRFDELTGEITFRGCRMVGNYGAAFLASKFKNGHYWQERVRLENCHLETGDGETGGIDGFIFDVPGGEVTGCTLQMRDKVAYLGWSSGGEAGPRFVSNTVYGRNPARHRPIFVVRPGRGAPLVQGNRFIGQHSAPKAQGAGAWLVMLDNPNAIVRNNSFSLPARAHPGGGIMQAVYANVAQMSGNSYTTEPGAGGAFAVVYTNAAAVSAERFPTANPSTSGPIRSVVRGRSG